MDIDYMVQGEIDNMNNFVSDFEVENNYNDKSYNIDTVIESFKTYMNKNNKNPSPQDVVMDKIFKLNEIPRSINIYPKEFKLSQIEEKRVNNRYSSINIKSKFKQSNYIDIYK